MNRKMYRLGNRSLPDDSHLPQLDDDLQTLISKSKAVFNRQLAMPSRITNLRDQTPPPRQPPATTPSRNGLMQRPKRG